MLLVVNFWSQRSHGMVFSMCVLMCARRASVVLKPLAHRWQITSRTSECTLEFDTAFGRLLCFGHDYRLTQLVS